MNISELEQRLLDKELNRIQTELNRGVKIITEVLSELPRACNSAEALEEETLVLKQIQIARTYKTGEWKHAMRPLVAAELPESMRARILKGVVKTFLVQIEELNDVVADLEERS